MRQLTVEMTFQSEPLPAYEARGVAADPGRDNFAQSGASKINSTPPPIAHGLAGTSPDERSRVSQPESNTSQTGAAVKQEVPEFRLSENHTDGSGKSLAVPAWPSDAPGAPDTRGVSGPGVAASAGGSAAEIGLSEPEIKAGVEPPITRQISLKLSTDDSTPVSIRLTERAGKVLVAVRTPDHELAQSLQTGLGDLVGRLESKGFKTETWIPVIGHPEAIPLPGSNSNAGFGQSQHSSTGNQGGQQRQGQSPNQRQKGRWAVAQLEATTSADEARREN